MARALILGCCATGAKFTPFNHDRTGDRVLDAICLGENIPKTLEEVARELPLLSRVGSRYYHIHARDAQTGEQTTDNSVYSAIGAKVHGDEPEMVLSFAASRNGPLVRERVNRLGEWERISQAGLAAQDGGAEFITLHAAIELLMITDLEKQGQRLTVDSIDTPEFLERVRRYAPSGETTAAQMETNSTARGSSYGESSPAVQMEVLRRAIEARRRVHLHDEVEWVQFARSYGMSRMAIERPDIALGGAGQLNVTILFGFSSKLPFPESYQEFRAAVAAAKRLQYDVGTTRKRREITVTVGAAVLPQHAARLMQPLDIGPRKGAVVDAVARLAAYAAQDDSEVDVFRAGMEDTPYMLDPGGAVRPTTNVELVTYAAEQLDSNGASLITDPAAVRKRLAISAALQ